MEFFEKLPFSSVGSALRFQGLHKGEKRALLFPSAVKNCEEYDSLNFRQFDNLTNRIGMKIDQHLEKLRDKEKSLTCAIFASGGVEFLLCQFGLLKIDDVVMFPISTRNSQPAIEHLLTETKTVLILTTEQFLPIIEKIREKNSFRNLIVLRIDQQDFLIEQILKEKDESIEPNSFKHLVQIEKQNQEQINKVVVILHSSGSTAHPKAIYLTNRYFILSIFQYFSVNENYWREDDVTLSWAALFHLLAFNGMTRTILLGSTYALPLCVSFPPKPDELVRNILPSNGITVLSTVPSLLEQLIRELLSEKYQHIGLEPLKKFRFIMYGGAGCPEDLCRTLVENGIVLTSVYGATETGLALMKNISPYDGRWKHMQIAPVRRPFIRLEQPKESENSLEKLLVHLANDPFLAENVPFGEDGNYVVGDIFVEDPPDSGSFYILGRQDDILVHVNGEKTNPIPMEQTIRNCSIVKQVVIVGHNQFNTAAIVELDFQRISNFSREKIEEILWKFVEEANDQAPSHSKVLRPLIHILEENQTIPTTHKGNLMRRNVNQQYSQLISTIYEKFFNKNQENSTSNEIQDWKIESIREKLKEKVQSIVEIFDCSRSLFDFGLNSLQIVELTNWIRNEIVDVGPNFLYENSSIDRISESLIELIESLRNGENVPRSTVDRFHFQLTENILEKFIKSIKEEKFIQNEENFSKEQKRIILITGGNGHLANFLIRDLIRIDSEKVEKIFCLVRGSNPKERFLESLKERCFDISVFEKYLDDRLIVLPYSMDLNKKFFGQTAEIYEQLEKNVTDIIHCAWKVNFNQNIEHFQDDVLVGHVQLLKLAMFNRKQFHFISSVASASSGILSSIKEEPLPRTAHIALPQGYGQSKYIAEHLCWTAMELWKVPVSIYRVGQISGDTENGIWNTKELAPMMIYAGAGNLKKLPNIGRDIRWIPIDICSKSIVDLILNVGSFDLALADRDRVFHLVSPHKLAYKDYLECLKTVGLEFEIVSPKEFLETLLLDSNKTNPLVKLSSFIEKTLQAQEKNRSISVDFQTIKTRERCQVLDQCPPINEQSIERYIKFWKKCHIFFESK